MSICGCSLAGTAACRKCSNNPFAEQPPVVRTYTISSTDAVLITGRKTNADRIRAMSDEELAKLIAENIDCCVCKSIHHAEDDCCPTVSSKACPDMWLDWLRHEVSE